MLSPRKAAELLDVSPRRVQEFIRDGRIAAENIGTDARPRYVIQEQELERFAALSRPHHRPRKDKTMSHAFTVTITGEIDVIEVTDIGGGRVIDASGNAYEPGQWIETF